MPNFLPALPEIFIALAGLALLLMGVFQKKDSTTSIGWLSVGVLAVAALLVWTAGVGKATAFDGLFVVDRFAGFVKLMVLLASGLTIVMSLSFLEKEQIGRFEYPVVTLFATLGMLMMVSANNFMSLYLGLELQSLALYVLAAYQRDSLRSTESGLKYFVLGSLASGLLLYGITLIYGFAGSTSFTSLARVFAGTHGEIHAGVITGIVFVLAGLAFKISAVPFHMWTPDVYEGAPTPVTAFFSVAPKIAAFALLVRVMVGPFGDLVAQWQQVVVFISIGSMVLGSFAAIVQTNIKRLMAYSSIGHVGYALIGLAVGNEAGVRGVLIYFAIYMIMNIGSFTIILSMRQKGRLVENIDDLAGLSKTHPMMAFAMAVFMFSMAGIPPLAGFWGKFYVFMAAIEGGMVTLAVIGVLTSVVGAFYYLRIIKVMYFDEVVEAFDKPIGGAMASIMGLSTLFILVFSFVPAPLVASAQAAAASLFAG